ncbi:MAG TPA: peptidoglycan-binding protein [Luteibacter sp.]|jgi:putative chitinase|uniref:peptidoglycan-binding protein n=1 Tax=Luteibacter sp. TaxID=1886636 RepID=UPI002F41C017
MTMDRESQLATLAYHAGISHPLELANFMAQVCHESQGLTCLEESFRYSRGIEQIPVRYAWRHGREALENARKLAVKDKPEALADLMYGDRMGNDAPGDGFAYRGRGYIQLTGRNNYEAAGNALDIDLVSEPHRAAEPRTASRIAIWYWQTRVPTCVRQNLKAATMAINGGFNGLEDRQARFVAWVARLTRRVMDGLAEGTALPPLVATAPRALKPGSRGEDVRALQADLAHLGFTAGTGDALVADGVFGPATTAAVKAFQRQLKLDADGIAGPATLAAIATRLAPAPL